MKAIRKTVAGKGAKLVEVERPVIGVSDLLVEINAAAICRSDVDVYEWTPSVAQGGYKIPFTMGHEYSGEVVEVGSAVRGFAKGDFIAGETHVPCGHCRACRTGKQHICDNGMGLVGRSVDGCFSPYMRVPVAAAIKIDRSTKPEHAAVFEPLGVAVHALQAGRVSGKIVAVFGCGTIGRMTVELAKLLGASTVVAVSSTASKIPDVLAHGADFAVDSRKDNPAEAIKKIVGGVDVAVETSGDMGVIGSAIDSLAVGGRLVLMGTVEQPFTVDRFMRRVVYREIEISGIFGRLMYETWDVLTALVKLGRLDPGRYVSEVMPMSEFESAFEKFKQAPGRIILTPAE
jgi:threonine 3-dehydrogenase